ncbi:hypothetical protein BB558_001746 [Smittium angustum]|uniref:Conserved oligomeric Golgi complex subunit 7 n=1 Tax=Smittium angustum TaxID=133377 RepID=A0A2U1JAF5_SMIAN|nr:hypothetical protein BB558_001746 [Smittium angustum]
MEVEISLFENQDFNPIDWLNSVLTIESLNTTENEDSQQKSNKGDNLNEKSLGIDNLDINKLETKISHLTNRLAYLSTEAQSNQDRTRIRLERATKFLGRDLERFRGILKSCLNELTKIEPNLPLSEIRNNTILEKVAKTQIVRQRLYETKAAFEKIQDLLNLPKQILKLKNDDLIIEASEKLKEAMVSVKQLDHMSKSNLIDLLGEKKEESVDTKSNESIKSKNEISNIWKSIHENFKIMEMELLNKSIEKLSIAFSTRNYEDCKIWVKFLSKSGNFQLVKNTYTKEKGEKTILAWKEAYNNAIINTEEKNSLDRSETEKPDSNIDDSLIGKFRIMLELFLEELVSLLEAEYEFCEAVEIDDPQLTILDMLEKVLVAVGNDTKDILYKAEKEFENIQDQTQLEQLVELYKVVLFFIDNVDKNFSSSTALLGVGVEVSVSTKEANLLESQTKKGFKRAFSNILLPFVPLQQKFIKYEGILLSRSIKKMIEKVLVPEKGNGKSYNKKSELINKNEFSEKVDSAELKEGLIILQKLKDLITKSLFITFKEARKRIFAFTKGTAALGLFEIFDQEITYLITQVAKFICSILERTGLISGDTINFFKANSNSQKKDIITGPTFSSYPPLESAFWWSQMEFVLHSSAMFIIIGEQISRLSVDIAAEAVKHCKGMYELDDSMNLFMKEDISEPESTLSLSTLNSTNLVNIYAGIFQILTKNETNLRDSEKQGPVLDAISEKLRNLTFGDFWLFGDYFKGKNVDENSQDKRDVEVLRDIFGLVFPKALGKLLEVIFTDLQYALFILLFGPQLGIFRNMLNQNEPSTKGLNDSNYNAMNRLNANIKIPQFSYSPSASIRAIGEQVLLLPMILEQIESKNIIKTTLNDIFNATSSDLDTLAERNLEWEFNLLGNHVLSLAIVFNRIGFNNLSLEKKCELAIEGIHTHSTNSHNWLTTVSESTMDTFVLYAEIKKEEVLLVKQLVADMDYLKSIFQMMNISLDGKFEMMYKDIS